MMYLQKKSNQNINTLAYSSAFREYQIDPNIMIQAPLYSNAHKDPSRNIGLTRFHLNRSDIDHISNQNLQKKQNLNINFQIQNQPFHENVTSSLKTIIVEKDYKVSNYVPNYYDPSQSPLLTSFKVTRFKPIKLLNKINQHLKEDQQEQCKFQQGQNSLENSHQEIQMSFEAAESESQSSPFFIVKNQKKQKKIYRRNKGICQEKKKHISQLAIIYAQRQKQRLLIHRAKRQKAIKKPTLSYSSANNVKIEQIQSQQLLNYNMHASMGNLFQNNQFTFNFQHNIFIPVFSQIKTLQQFINHQKIQEINQLL